MSASFLMPEERELVEKTIDLESLEAMLAQKELERATLLAELSAFETTYMEIIGKRLVELNSINYKIAKIIAGRNPANHQAQEEVNKAKEKIDDSENIILNKNNQDFHPTENIKELYRKTAKAIHPDKALDNSERDRRNHLMAEVNQAYADGNEGRIFEIFRDWQSSPELITGDDTAAKLVRTIRQIAQIKARLLAIEEEMRQIYNTELYELKKKVDETSVLGRSLIEEMAMRLDAEIKQAYIKLQILINGHGR